MRKLEYFATEIGVNSNCCIDE